MLTGALEDNVLIALCYTPLCHTIAQRVVRDTFTTRAHKRIAEVSLTYIQKYHQPPGFHLRDLLERYLEKGDEGKLIARIIDEMDLKWQDMNTEFVRNSLDNFVAVRKFQTALDKASDFADQGLLEEAGEAMREGRTPQLVRSGIWLSDTKQSLRFMERKEQDYFATGVPMLDDSGIRPERGTMLLLIAPPGMGKSWFLISCGKEGIVHHKRVYHASLEMDEDDVSQRYVQSVLAMSDEQVDGLQLSKFRRDAEGQFLGQIDKTFDPMVLSEDNHRIIMDKMRFLERRPPFRIESFPSGSLSVAQLDMRLDSLKEEHDFEPDLLLLDYPDLMKQDTSNYRLSLNHTFVELRGLAQARNLALVVVTQGNRESAGAKMVRGKHIAEDFSKIATADKILTYSQTEEEKLHNRARLFVEKGRTKRDKFTVWILQAYAIGQFCTDSIRLKQKDVKRLEEQDQDADQA